MFTGARLAGLAAPSLYNPMTLPQLGKLYIVAVPIGHPKDITLRALDVLREVDAVICEEQRQGSTLLKKLGIENRLICLNEHNEATAATEILQEMLLGHSYALVSDCGTPVFADPGQHLISLLEESGLETTPIPGASSLMAALSVCDFPLKQFVFGGFLPRDDHHRRKELMSLRSAGKAVVLMDTPYRMTALLQDVAKTFGPGRRILLACDLTLPTEHIYRGPVEQVLRQVAGQKREFILIVQEGSR